MTRTILAGITALSLLGGCSHAPPPPEAAPTPAASMHWPSDAMKSACPMAVPGTEVSATDSVSGETLTFTTTGQVDDLRTRVRAMAAIHNQHHAPGNGPEGMLGGEMMSRSHATVVEVDGGSSIVLTPNDPADLQLLQAEVRMRAHRMRLNGCGMMGQAKG